MSDGSDNDILVVTGINSKGYGLFPKLVAKDKRLSIESKAIYAYFCSYAGSGNTAFPKVPTIIDDLDIGETRYHKHLKLLTNFGYISIQKIRSEGGTFKHNVYTLNTEIFQVQPHPQNRGMVVPNQPHPQNPGMDNRSNDNRGNDNEGTNINSLNINTLNIEEEEETVKTFDKLIKNGASQAQKEKVIQFIKEHGILKVNRAIELSIDAKKPTDLIYALLTDWIGLETLEEIEIHMENRKKVKNIRSKKTVKNDEKKPEKYSNFYL